MNACLFLYTHSVVGTDFSDADDVEAWKRVPLRPDSEPSYERAPHDGFKQFVPDNDKAIILGAHSRGIIKVQ